MKITINKLIIASQSLGKINSHDFNFSISMILLHNIKAINEVERIFREKQNKIVNSYKDGDGNISPEDLEIANQKIKDISAEEIDIDLKMLKPEYLEEVNLSGFDLFNIEWLIESNV